MIENKRYDVIYEKEPRGQVVTIDGVPCTARTCCTRLNRLEEENKELKERLSHAEKVNIGLIDENHRLRLTIIHSSNLNFDINWLKENLKDWNNYE